MKQVRAYSHATRVRLPDGTRSVQSVWVWRGFLFMAFIGLGLTINFAVEDRILFAAAWAFITAGWLAISMWLWRQHLRYESGGRG
ncbi:MAG: hypothetical protein ACYCO3_05220 [Mycobacteriales bacterium]